MRTATEIAGPTETTKAGRSGIEIIGPEGTRQMIGERRPNPVRTVDIAMREMDGKIHPGRLQQIRNVPAVSVSG